jgi:hypothetical protein
MNFSAASLRRIKNRIKQNKDSANSEKIILDLTIQEGKSNGISIRRTTVAIVKTVKLSRILSMTIVPSAEDIFIELLLEIKYGLASSPIRAGMAAMAKNPTEVTEKRET